MNNTIGFLLGFTLTLAAFWAMAPEIDPDPGDVPSYQMARKGEGE